MNRRLLKLAFLPLLLGLSSQSLAAESCHGIFLEKPSKKNIAKTMTALAELKLSVDLTAIEGNRENIFPALKADYENKKSEIMKRLSLSEAAFKSLLSKRIAKLQNRRIENAKREQIARENQIVKWTLEKSLVSDFLDSSYYFPNQQIVLYRTDRNTNSWGLMDMNTGTKESLSFTGIKNIMPIPEKGLFLFRYGQNHQWTRYDISQRKHSDLSAEIKPWQDSLQYSATVKNLQGLTPDRKYFVFTEQKYNKLFYIQIDVSNGQKVSSGEIPDQNYLSLLMVDKNTLVLGGEDTYTKLHLPNSKTETISAESKNAHSDYRLSEDGKTVMYVDLDGSTIYKLDINDMKLNSRTFNYGRIVNIDHEYLWIHYSDRRTNLGTTTKVRISDLSDDNQFETVEGALHPSLFTNISKDLVLLNRIGLSDAPFGIYFRDSLSGPAPFSFNGKYDEGSPYRIHQVTAAASGDKLYIEYQKGSEFGLDVWNLKTGSDE